MKNNLSMKIIGFISEHNDMPGSMPFASYIEMSSQALSSEKLHKVINYLETGPIVLAWMNFINDLETGEPAVPNGYHSDGQFVWPSYLAYYIKKHRAFPIDESFLEAIRSSNYVPPTLSKNKALEIESWLAARYR